LKVSKNSKRGFLVGGIAVLVLAVLVVGFRGSLKNAAPPSFERPPAAVTLAVATSRDVPVYLDEIGKTVAREMVSVSPQVTGRMMEIHFTDGADVKKGDPLFTIDPRPFQAQLDSALATLAKQKAELDLARTQFARYAELVTTNAVSQAEYDTRKNTVSVDQAQVKQAEADVDTARLNLQYCSIRSPIDGRAGRRLVDIGNVVEANKTPLLTIQKIDPIYADFTINQNELTSVQGNMRGGTLKVEVRLPDEPDRPVAGQLTFLDNAVQDATGTVQLRATVDNHERRLWPGRLVKVRLVLSTIPNAVLIPAAAPQMSAKGQFVYVVKEDLTAELRIVKTGQAQEEFVVVEQGVKPGEKVVVNGQLGVTPGGKVRDASAAPAAPPAAGKAAGGKA
jgi:multidrug efflux system membrane fusion protein